MNNEKYSRTIGLIGKDNFEELQNMKILLVGLGGVGGTAFEALLRIGFKNFTIVDLDKVALSNLNRQILYVVDNIGENKVDAAKRKALSIEPEAKIETYAGDIRDFKIKYRYDMVIDCIDNVDAKIDLISRSVDLGLPIITSMGMANKLDPSQIKVDTLNHSTVDPLAKKVRYLLKQKGIDISRINCAYSPEVPTKGEYSLNSLITVTSTAGLYIANYVLSFLKRK